MSRFPLVDLTPSFVRKAVLAATACLVVAAGPAAAEPAFLGMQVQGVDAAVADALAMEPRGVLVRDVALGGPAAAAGIRRGDLILEFAGRPVDSVDALVALAGSLKAGQAVDAVVVREGSRSKVGFKAGAWPDGWREAAGKFAAIPDLGLTLSSLTAKVRERFGVRWGTVGVVVTLIDEEKAKASGSAVDLKAGEVIAQVNQRAVWDPDQILTEYRKARESGRKALLLLVEGSVGGRAGFRFSLLPVK